MVPKIWRTRLFVFTLVLVCIHYITLLYKTFGYEASHPYNSNQISNVGEEHIVVPQSVRHFHLRKELESKARAIQTVEENFPDLIEDSTMDNISDLPSLNEQNKAQEEDNNPAATLSKSTGKLEEMGKLRAKRRKHRKGRKDKDFPQKRMILAWTWLHSRKPLWGIKPHSFKKCKYNNCYLTADRSQLDRADLLLFRIRELKRDLNKPPHRPYVSALDYSDMPPYHKPGQLWMDINQESPLHTHSDEELIPLDDKFNISVNYLLDSDLSISYIPVVRRLASPTKSNINFAAGKTKMALWFVSHCDAPSGRDAYVEALQQQGISVDIFGKCSGLTDGCLHNNFTCYHEVRSKYRFYLALENSVCNEYITEKFWNTLNSPAYNIPIALGARLSEYEKFSPPNSYLHVRNFTGVTELAKYMKRVAADDELFNSYHKWRDTHEIIPRVSESLHCYMCKVANEKTSGNEAYAKLSSYWSRKKNCELEPEPFKR